MDESRQREEWKLNLDQQDPNVEITVTVDSDRYQGTYTRSGKAVTLENQLGDDTVVLWSGNPRNENESYQLFPAKNVVSIDIQPSTSQSSLFQPSADVAVIFEKAPTKSGEVFWIYEITEPNEFFAECETDDEVLEKLTNSDRSPDEIVETCGYTLVLDSPEDPSPNRVGDPPQQAIGIEVIRDNGQSYEFYDIENPAEIFSDSWGNTTEMFEAIIQNNIDPRLSYDNVSMKFQRPYGSL